MAEASEPKDDGGDSSAAIEVDGSLLEGGGQVLRNAVAFAALLKKRIQFVNIRGGRKVPGLRAQHLTGMQLVAAIVGGTLEGAAVKSQRVLFDATPGKEAKGEGKTHEYEANTATAGSIALLLQTSLLCALFQPDPVRVRCTGGTNADMAPAFEYVERVLAPVVRRCTGARFDLAIRRRGYFPKGGGVVEMVTEPLREPLRPIVLMERGDVVAVTGLAVVGGTLPLHVAERMRDSAVAVLRKALPPTVRIEVQAVKESAEFAPAAGCFIFLRAETTTSAVIGTPTMCGHRKKRAEAVGREAADALVKELEAGGCVDAHLQDQLIVFMALADGHSSVRCAGPELTLHTRTAIHWATQLTGATFTVSQQKGHIVIECDGIALQNSSN